MAQKVELNGKIAVAEEMETMEHSPLYDVSRRVLLAGIGAVALAQEEVEEFVERLVERGEIAEKDGRRLVRDVLDKRKKRAEAATDKLDEALDGRLEELLARMNVPSKGDIEALSAKITSLTKKVEELKKAQQA